MNEKLRKVFRIAVLLLSCALLFTACASERKKPVTVTLWHVYGGQTGSPLNRLIDEFNDTVGKEQNIQVLVDSVSNANDISSSILAAARGDPGAHGLPDMFSSYPATVYALPKTVKLVNYLDYFSETELSGFVPAFVEDGMVEGRLLILPVAKSAEVMFVNRTLFDRFAERTGAKLSDLTHWGSLFKTAEKYAAWTDAQTPGIPDDGRRLLAHDWHINYFETCMASSGDTLTNGSRIIFGPAFRRFWEPYARAALSGGLWLGEGYATDPLRTADVIVSIGSSASVMYYSDVVTYPDNTSQTVQWQIMPAPTLEGGRKLASQFGVGLCTVKSTPERERACIAFLKWLTDDAINVEFVTSVGYLPVKQATFGEPLSSAVDKLTDPKYVSLYRTYVELQKNYEWYTVPQGSGALEMFERFEKLSRQTLLKGRTEYLNGEFSLDDGPEKTLSDFRLNFER